MYPLVKTALFYKVHPLVLLPGREQLHSTEEERSLLEPSHIQGTLQYVRPLLSPRCVGVHVFFKKY